MFPDPRPYLTDLDDPRRQNKNKLHKLEEVVFIVLCAVLSGIEDWVGMEAFAEVKEDWLRQFIELPNGVPSHDTLSDIVGRIDPKPFAGAFTRWVETALPSLAGEHVAIDGKTLRGSDAGQGAIHLMSAFASRARWVLAQHPVDGKSHEITAIPDLLSFLDLRGATITIDAMGCQRSIAKQIVDAQADYVLALKENQPTLHADVKLFMDAQVDAGFLSVHQTLEKDRGRLEMRRYFLSDQSDWLPHRSAWEGLSGLGMVESTREIRGAVSTERRYFITSFTDLARFAQTVRRPLEHREFGALGARHAVRRGSESGAQDRSAANLALIQHMSLNILRKNGPDKRSLRNRKLRASLNDAYRAELLVGQEGSLWRDRPGISSLSP